MHHITLLFMTVQAVESAQLSKALIEAGCVATASTREASAVVYKA